MRYAIILEPCGSNWSAHVPDLPGCVATGTSIDETRARLREAIEMHLAGLREDGLPIPPPSITVDSIEVAA
jgi:predicted RNase H-like HicB family nuclease